MLKKSWKIQIRNIQKWNKKRKVKREKESKDAEKR